MPILLKAEEGYACIYLNDNEGRARGFFKWTKRERAF